MALNALHWILEIRPLVLFHQRSPDLPLETSSSLLHSLSFPYWVCSSCLNSMNTWCWLQILFSTMSANVRAPNEVQTNPEGSQGTDSSNAGLTSSETISRPSRKDFSVLYLHSHPIPSTGIHAEPSKYLGTSTVLFLAWEFSIPELREDRIWTSLVCMK